MTAQVILADFKTRTWHKPNESLEQMANVIFAECFPPTVVGFCDLPRVAPDFSEKEGA